MADQLQHATEALRKALVQVERLKSKNRALLERAGEPIAIVGMSCRFPGGVESPDGLWDMVAQQRDVMSGSSRPTAAGIWPGDSTTTPMPRTSVTRVPAGSWTARRMFDAGFFGISPREALAIDPQQRMLLEVCLGGAGAGRDRPGDAAGQRHRGVRGDARRHGYGSCSPTEIEGYRLTGSTASVVSGRVSYVLGLEGPAVSVDTACSSSLVAMHLACAGAAVGGVRRWRWRAG